MVDLQIWDGDSRKVIVPRQAVALFNAQWPCSELRTSRHYWFEFDTDGNLIDCDVPSHEDGSAAVALAADCLAWLDDGTSPAWLCA